MGGRRKAKNFRQSLQRPGVVARGAVRRNLFYASVLIDEFGLRKDEDCLRRRLAERFQAAANQ
jgi:hypothetical protein